jgi:hypothetical protein
LFKKLPSVCRSCSLVTIGAIIGGIIYASARAFA